MVIEIDDCDCLETSAAAPAPNRLIAWLDDGVDSHGARYLEIRRRLIEYFDRHNRPEPEEMADETLRRINDTLEEREPIHAASPAAYCYVVAKRVLLGDLATAAVRVAAEQRAEALDRNIEALPVDERALLVEYYGTPTAARGDRRRALAERLGVSLHTLAVRAWHVRDAIMRRVQLS
jgi:DNA-directed RNA polymerase specialized sigma24 family protein